MVKKIGTLKTEREKIASWPENISWIFCHLDKPAPISSKVSHTTVVNWPQSVGLIKIISKKDEMLKIYLKPNCVHIIRILN
jgi:hypothetical protein